MGKIIDRVRQRERQASAFRRGREAGERANAERHLVNAELRDVYLRHMAGMQNATPYFGNEPPRLIRPPAPQPWWRRLFVGGA